MTFAKRINELGYELRPEARSEEAHRLAYVRFSPAPISRSSTGRVLDRAVAG